MRRQVTINAILEPGTCCCPIRGPHRCVESAYENEVALGGLIVTTGRPLWIPHVRCRVFRPALKRRSPKP